VPVGLIDPDLLSVKTMNTDRRYSVGYLEYCLRKYAKKNYVMFAHNCGGHWIAVIIVPKWQKVMYLDSNRGRKSDFSPLKYVTDK
jgi:amino-acid N-acetyltransferase